MDRAALGLGSIFLRMEVKLNRHRLYHDLVDGFAADGLGGRQQELLARHGFGVNKEDW